jgi:hypothetical protein
MQDGVVSINYGLVEEKISGLQKGIEDMYTNIENIDRKTKDVVGVEWVGNDALAMQATINDFLGALRHQADSLNTISKNLTNYVNEMKENEKNMSTSE